MNANRSFRTADRGASNTVHYVLSLAMAATLFVGLVLAAGSLVDDQRDRAAADELSIAGNRLASDLVAIDALARPDDDASVSAASLAPALPDTVGGEAYVVSVAVSGGDPYRVTIALRVPTLDVERTVTTTTTRPVAEGTYAGGDLVVRYVPGATPDDPGSIEVVSADG